MRKHKTINNFWKLLTNSVRLFRLSWGYMPVHTTLLIVLAMAMGIIPIISYKVLGNLIDSLIASINSGDFSQVWSSMIFYVLLTLLPSLALVINKYVDRIFFLRMQDYFDLMVLRKRASFDVAQYENPKFLDFLHVAFNNGQYPMVNLIDGLIGNVQMLAGIVVGSVAALLVDWKVFLIVFVASIPMFIIDVKRGGKLWNILQENSTEQRRMLDLRRFFSMNTKYAVIDGKLFGVADKFLNYIKSILHDFTSRQLKTEKGVLILVIFATIFSSLGFLLGLWIIVKNAIIGAIAIGSVVYIIQTLSQVSSQTSKFLSELARLLERNLYVTDIFTVLDTKPALKKTDKPKRLNLVNNALPRVEFKNVYFKYEGSGRYAIEDVSFVLEPGEKLGLVGNNGSGKTTIVKILLRIYDPSQGEVLVNGINLKEIDQEEWWSYVGVLLQDYVTYNFTVKESIAVGKINEPVNVNVVERAAKQSTASTFVELLGNKLDHQIGAEFGGIEPSKGQRQKLAIAKALYREAKILILDEPTASIDSESASRIFYEIENLPPTTSAILISHNFATIKRANKIIVMENGRIVEQGSHDELIAKDGRYAKAYSEQKKEFE